MALIKITRNCQITIPSEIRKKMGVKERDYLDIEIENGKIVLKKNRKNRKKKEND
ncbi:AbrB/MazE/SpoVT family DNA-binding domain-containing protein [Methanothermococcus sp. Ax23]|uniref:AbrB/MazE/SpoVT family DNA-binding domain-containing protein n=1 Tax=Methanothermococcus sp. Ax23 TaxID=3156486 RepID=UPI003B9FCD4B